MEIAFVLIPLVLFLVVGIVVFAVKSAAGTRQAWAQAAAQLGLRNQPSGFLKKGRVTGKVEGIAVVVDTITRGGGNHSRTFTRIRVYHPTALPGNLKLTAQGVMASVAKFLGVRDIEVGDKAFDDAVLVKAKSPTKAKAYLTKARRVLIGRFLQAHSRAVIDEHCVTVLRKGKVSHAGILTGAVHELVTLVRGLDEDTLEDRAPHPRPGEHSGPAGDADEAPAPVAVEPSAFLEVEELPPPPPVDVVEPSAERTPAAEPPTGITADEPPSPRTVPEPDAPTPPLAPAGDPEGLEVGALCAALFGPGISSLDAGKVFEASHRGQSVRWSGTLRSADSFTYDFVFGNEAGTKATLAVHRIEQSSYGDKWALAVVQLPPEVRDSLHARVGETVTFRGVLGKVDAFMTTLFVADGELV